MNGTRHLTADTLYWLPDSDNQGQQSRPVNVYVRLFPQDQTFISPGFFFPVSSDAFTNHDPRNDAPQKISQTRGREREREVLSGPGEGQDSAGTPIHSKTTHTEPILFLGTGTYLKKLSQDGNTIPMLFLLTSHQPQ
jgi:hypothetical protein